MAEPVSTEIRGGVAIVTIQNPPVNALSHSVRASLAQILAMFDRDSSIGAVVLACAGKSFSAGADLRELGLPPAPPSMGEVMRSIDAMRPILVAAIHGQALGGGLELALLCDYRVATADAKLGFPEIRLGLIPGGGGTQRLPRLIPASRAIDMIVSGKPISAEEALASGLIDEIAEGDPVAAAERLARRHSLSPGGKRRLSEAMIAKTDVDFESCRAEAVRSAGLEAAGRAVDAVEAATTLDFAAGIAREAELFQQCRQSTESAALRHLFAGERAVAHVPGAGTPREVRSTAVIGAGTMGAGVTIALLDAGLPVTLIEVAEDNLERGLGNIGRTYDSLVQRGRLSSETRDERLARLQGSTALSDAAKVDLVIECVFEKMEVKQAVFANLGGLTRADTVLATNTSALDVDAIAKASGRPQDVVGMHFFSPANIMRLVEVVKAGDTAPDVLATAMAVAKRMGKIGVVAGMCDGFIGNRMVGGYLRQAALLLLEGASPEMIDGALKRFGMAMGPHAMGDMAGLDIQAAGRERRRAEGKIPPDDLSGVVGDLMVAEGRLGLKTGRGVYRYEAGSRQPIADAAVEALIAREAERLGIRRKTFAEDEIVDRCILPLVNEGARIIEEGIALGAVDIDVVYCNGYGFPRHRGGPMFWADTIGTAEVLRRIETFRDTLDPRHWQPATLLSRLAADNARFSDLPRGAFPATAI